MDKQEEEVFSLIKKIEATSSRTEKEEILEDLVKFELGVFAIKWAYDPFITFGVRPSRRDNHDKARVQISLTPGRIEPLLKSLASRLLTGNAAEREIFEVMTCLTDAGAEILYRILSKDLKCGVGEATLNRVVPGIVPTFCVMRAHPFEEKRVKSYPQIIEPKLDGFRYTFIARNGGGGFFTRSGKRAPSVDHMVAPIIEIARQAARDFPELAWMIDKNGNAEFVLDGEMIAGGSFNETSGALRRESEEATDAKFHIFDMMPWADFDAVGSVGAPYTERRRLVSRFIETALSTKHAKLATKTPAYSVGSFEEAMIYYRKFRERGFEGAMVKDPNGLYDKKKSYGWMKIKPEETEDLMIVGAFPGEPGTKYENCLGGLIVQRVAKGIGIVQVRVGGGFTDDQRIEFWGQFHDDLRYPDKSCVTKTEKGEITVGTAVIGVSDKTKILFNLMEVEFHEVTPDGSLRHPRFIRLRGDKKDEVESKDAA